jgi:peroxiredoxin
VVLGVDTSDARDKVVEVLNRAGVTFPNILDTTMKANMAMMKYETLSGRIAVPMTYVIDREGKVVDAWYGYKKTRTENAIQELQLDEHR